MRKGEIITAGLFMVLSGIVIAECFRLGFGWEPQAGPQAGMVPFYLALLMFGCSAYVMYLGLKSEKKEGDNFFINKDGMMEAIKIAFTALIFSIILVYAGVYFAMLIYAPLFVKWLGKHKWSTVILFTAGIVLVIYFGMEVGLKIPLPRSPLYMQGKFFI
ncbi:tripartite tricarboxylate transporter TctB family protein [bacterium]|nr:tripartite tricarboxylate transporter TctB family protein [bacterium]